MIDFLSEYSEYVKSALAVVAVVMSFMIGWIFRPYDGAEYEEMRHKINTLRIDAINYQSSIEANALTVRMQREMIDILNLDLDRIKGYHLELANTASLAAAHISKLEAAFHALASQSGSEAKLKRKTIVSFGHIRRELLNGTLTPAKLRQYRENLIGN